MSRRAIRRLEDERRRKDDSLEDGDGKEDGSEVQFGREKFRGMRRNPFDLLDEGDGQEEEEDEVELAEEEPVEKVSEESVAVKGGVETGKGGEEVQVDGGKILKVAAGKEGKKKKKRGRKKKAKGEKKEEVAMTAAAAQDFWTDEENEAFQKQVDDLMVEIERTSEITPKVEEGRARREEPKTVPLVVRSSLMDVDPKRLQATSELRRMFGSHVLQELQGEGGSGTTTSRRGRRAPRVSHPIMRKKLYLINPREGWAPFAPGLSMSLLTTKPPGEKSSCNATWFQYEYSSQYATIQTSYVSAVETHDPNNLVAFITHHPYHVDTLLQLAEVHRDMGELDRAALMIERALCLLERSWHTLFKPFDGSCRLSYGHAPNRSLFIALFRYSQLLTRRGLHRTAFEVTKLLYNLNPDADPMGSMLCIDTLALLCRENQWLVDMVTSDGNALVHSLPNFALSAALAAKKLQRHDASVMLHKAIATFPMVVAPLLRACNDNSGFQFQHPEFAEDSNASPKAFTRISNIYGELGKLLWTEEELTWFKQVATEVITSKSISRYEPDRKKAMQILEASGLYRDVYVSDFAQSNTTLTRDVLEEPVGVPQQSQPVATPGQALVQFFNSFFPWHGTAEAAAAVAAGNRAPAAPLDWENFVARIQHLRQGGWDALTDTELGNILAQIPDADLLFDDEEDNPNEEE